MKNLNLKYACMDNIDQIINQYQNDPTIHQTLIHLKELIVYQMKEIRDQRIEIVAMKHNNSWKQYDPQK